MLRLHPRRALALTVALAGLAVITATAAPAATDVSGDPASATAPIEILGNPLPSAAAGDTPRTISEEVSFKNNAAVAATSIDFTWLFLDANGAVIGEQKTATHGRFAPNASIERNAASAAHVPGYASGEALFVGDEDTNVYEPVGHVAVMIDNATFADGSAWHSKTRQSNAPATQMEHDPSATAAHIRITRIRPMRANSLYDRVDTLLSFANDSSKRIDAIEFTYTFYDVDGNVIFQQPAIVRGAYPHGAVSTLNAATRVRMKGVVMNGGSVWMGWGDSAEYVAKIVAGVNAIRYSDGSNWNANS